MEAFIREMVANYLLAVAISIVVFGLLLAVIQRGRVGGTLRGFRAVLSSLLAGPGDYVRAALDQLVERGLTPRSTAASDRQLLAKRLLYGSQLAVVIGGLWIVSSNAADGWMAMAPKRVFVAEYRDAVKELDSLKRWSGRADTAIADLVAAWNADSLTRIANYAVRQRASIASSDSVRAAIRADFARRAAVARRQLGEPLAQLEAARTFEEADAAALFVSRVNDIVSSVRAVQPETAARLGFTPQDSGTFAAYLGAWRTARIAATVLRNWPGSGARARLQPEFQSQTAHRAEVQSRMGELSARLPEVKELARWKFELMALALVKALLTAFVFIWMAGFLVEIVWLLVDMADNLRRLRAHFDPSSVERPLERLSAVTPPGHRASGTVRPSP